MVFFDANLAQLVTFNLAHLVTFTNGHFLRFFAFKNVLKYLFLSVLSINQNLPQKGPPQKNDNFSQFAKHRLI